MHRYRSHTCGALRDSDIGQTVRLSGWCHRIRDHGGVLFIDLRDHYGLTQCVADPDSPAFKDAEKLPSAQAMIEDLASDHERVARRLHEVIKLAEDSDDPVTADLITARSAFHEKAAWMLRASAK